ncbi:uncharacterized protein STAUR_2389 [Stigmatella aurantiaca DW4/3-1]|uniref:Uncharacterized protein n=1 Tax=Stigmatella aurantiaca (strain DW4/3-1) TaxID=378806 RepID=E3FF12_STIAD|nr:uncharacterized protein STAUR_2389 [Stigmatella aurantiaca DW4/3-1]
MFRPQVHIHHRSTSIATRRNSTQPLIRTTIGERVRRLSSPAADWTASTVLRLSSLREHGQAIPGAGVRRVGRQVTQAREIEIIPGPLPPDSARGGSGGVPAAGQDWGPIP